MKTSIKMETYEKVINYATCEELEKRIKSWEKRGIITPAPTKYEDDATCYAIKIQFNSVTVMTFYFDYFPKERLIGYWEH